MADSLLTKIVRKYKPQILKIFDFLPQFLQKRIKSYYRAHINSFLYAFKVDKDSGSRKYENGSYTLPREIDFSLKNGVNLIGFPTGEFGLGQHLRSVGSAIEDANLQYSYYDCSAYFHMPTNDHSKSQQITANLDHKINIFVCNGDAIAYIFQDKGYEFFAKKYNIHYGAWELRRYPEEWIPTLGFFEEYWAMSSFLQKSVSDVATIPVLHMPYPVDFIIPSNFTRKDYNLPEDKFLYIFTFDMSSIMERKNPKAVIEAFYEAFPKEQDVGLVIKVMTKKDLVSQKEELNQLMEKLKNDKRVFLIDDVLPRDKMLGLINVCNVYVSLHRAEGLGIGMAEAMKMSKPVIATNYSGNTDFTLADNSCLVDYKLIPIKPLEYIYEKGKVWADADTSHAAFYMKKLFEDRKYYNSIATKGKKFIDTNYSIRAVKEKYLARLKILGLIK